MTIHNKLVRDRIPEYIRSQGGSFKSHIATHEEFMQKLHDKLLEETLEFIQDRSKEELADLLEVVDAVKKLHGWSDQEIELIRLEKLEKKGGFNDHIILEES